MYTNKRKAESSPVSEVPSKKQKISHETSSSPILASPRAEDTESSLEAAEVQPEPTSNDAPAPASASGSKQKKTPKNPPIKTCFNPWKPTITLPPPNPFWGIKPRTGDPRPAPTQPAARTSNAATNPPLWEDRKFRFKRGSRYVKFLGPVAPADTSNLPDLDQEDLLVLTLIDMRRKSSKDPTPRRKPVMYSYEHGKPKDWDNMQTVKALNDRRGQAIDRITLDDPWTRIEREYLASLTAAHSDISIWELTEKFNDRFMGVDHTAGTAFSWTELSSGRTVESVRHEYVTYKVAYENGEVPTGVRYKFDKSREGKELRAEGKMEKAFGKSRKDLEKEWDEQEEDTAKGQGKAKETKADKKMRDAAAKMAAQPALGKEDEELLDLAGVYAPEDIRSDPLTGAAQQAINEFLAAPDSPMSDAPDGLLTPILGLQSPGLEKKAAIEAAIALVQDVVELSAKHAEEFKSRSPSPKPEPAPLPRAARQVQIDDNYDDEEEL